MNIEGISSKAIRGVKRISQSYQNCPIKLRQNAQDVFIKSQSPEIKVYLEKLKQNPNTAFLFNPKLSHEDKMKLIKKSPTVFRPLDLTSESGVKSTLWLNESLFNIEQYSEPIRDGRASSFTPSPIIATVLFSFNALIIICF